MDIQPRYDCHNKTHFEVEDRLPNWLLLNHKSCPIYVITGNSEKMREIVTKIINQYGFNYVTPSYNYGLIIVL